MVKRAGRTDANHTPIVQKLRGLGYSVQDLSQVGGGCPDILVGVIIRGNESRNAIPINLIFEIKIDEKTVLKLNEKVAGPPKPKEPVQVTWHREWVGQKMIVSNLTDILHVIKAYERGEFLK